MALIGNVYFSFERFNAAANLAAERAFKNNVFSQPSVHRLCYYDIRSRFGLPAQLAVRAIGKAVEAYKRSKKIQLRFRRLSAIVYDARVLSIKSMDALSIASIQGRLGMPFVCRHCHYSIPADLNAARNIRARALVNAPIAGRSLAAIDGFSRTCKLPDQAGSR